MTFFQVRIDDEGVYKYIQIKISDESKNRQKILIRGFNYADYHADILDREQPGLDALGLNVKCIGGGRIQKDGKFLRWNLSLGQSTLVTNSKHL